MADQRIANNSVDSAPESGVAKRDAHTVGPWKVLNGHVYAERFIRDTVIVKDGVETPYTEGLIALVYTPMPAEPGEWTATSEANRRLIAAAPDLLAALKLAAPEYCSLRCPSVFTASSQPRHTPECAAIRAAIAKAEGAR
jgi:hypothetical protein